MISPRIAPVLVVLFVSRLAAQDAPPEPTAEERRIADDLVARAVASTGPRRSEESDAGCDARNREAMAFLWDAKWIRRADAGFSIEEGLAAARLHVSGPVFGDPRFRHHDALTSGILWRSGKGARLVTGTATGRVVVWDPTRGDRLAEIGEPEDHGVQFLAANERLVFASVRLGGVFAVDGSREVWRYRPTKGLWPMGFGLIRRGEAHELGVLMHDGLLRLDASTGAELGVVPLAGLEPYDGSFATEGSTFVAYGAGGVARVFEVDEGVREIRSVEMEELEPYVGFDESSPHRSRRAAISPSGRRVAATRRSGGVAVFDVGSGQEVASAPGELGKVRGLGFGDDRTVVFLSGDRTFVIDVERNVVSQPIDLPHATEWTALAPDDGLYVAKGCEWHVYDPSTGRRSRGGAQGHPAPAVHLVARSGRLLATGGTTILGDRGGIHGDGSVLLDPDRWVAVRSWSDLVVLDVDRAGKRLAGIAGDEYQVVTVDGGDVLFGRPYRAEGDAYTLSAPGAAFTADGREVFLVLRDGGFARFEVESSRELGRSGAGDPPSPLKGLVLHPNGRLLASGTVIQHRGQGILFDLTNGKSYGLGSNMHSDGRTTLGFSPDGRWIASAHAGPHVIDLTKPGEPLMVGRGLPDGVREERGPESIVAIAFSPDGKHLATVDQASRWPWDLGTRNTIVRVFAAGSWALEARYDVGARATAICWNEDSTGAWIGHADGTISELLLVR